MNFKQRADELLKKARAIVDANPDGMTGDQAEEVKSYMDERDSLIAQAKAAEKRAAEARRVFDAVPELDSKADAETADDFGARTLGDHFVKHAADGLSRQAAGERLEVSAPSFDGAKAASDPFKRPVDGTDDLAAWGTDFRRGYVNAFRDRLVIADLMGAANTTMPVIKYLVEKAKRILEGAPATVAEGAAKPYVRFDTFDIVTESISKIAALTKITDEMAEDYGFVADWINSQLIYELSVVEEQQLLSGDGSGSNLTGLLNREGLQSKDVEAGSEFDGLFEAMQLVPRATGLNADALVVNPADYVKLRLQKDGNQQYLAGGPFQGQYGNGGILVNPPVWGLKTVETPAIEEGKYVLGAFKQASTVLRKGGVRVDSATTNDKDFENNLVTLRAEERIGLMVTRPAAFVTGSLGAGAGA